VCRAQLQLTTTSSTEVGALSAVMPALVSATVRATFIYEGESIGWVSSTVVNSSIS